PRLTACQHDGASGKYAAALAGFIRWLARQYEAVRGGLRTELAELRDQVRGEGQHARMPGIVADLAIGLRYLLDFARSAGAVSEAERAALGGRGWAALTEAAAAHAGNIASAEPARLFLRLLSAAVASGYAHVSDQEGNQPQEPQRWGWRPDAGGAQGMRVGWLDDGELYLEPDAACTAVQRFARDQIESFPVTSNTLRRRLKERGLLATTDTARGKLTVRKTLQGARREVLHMASTAVLVGAAERGAGN